MFRLLALLFACSFWGILGLSFLHRRGMLPVGTLLRKCRRMPWLTQAFLALFVWHLVVSGSTKTNQTDNVGGDVTNEPPAGLMMGAPRRGAGLAPYGSDAVQLPRAPSVVWQAPVLGAGEAYSLFSSGTNETFDFSMPSNAVVATNWLAHGAATAWLRIRPADWEFPLGTNVLTEFAVSADGRVMPDPTDTNVCFAPLGVPLGLVPEANWGLLAATDRPSRFWWTLADGDLVCTWENALVGCRAEDPVTFQAAFSPSGNFAYRCDLSRLASGAEGAYSSVSFRSADDAACDAARADLDAILGDADPFAFPPGSTNTVLEHAFYAGSADGRFVFPASTEATAVLRVTATGAGRGELRVGGRVVPLVPRNGSPLALLVAVPKDETQRLYVRGDATLGVALSSDDFAFGILPDHRGGRRTGRINFPNTEATHPCIHSLNARETGVSLPVGADGGDLACAWQGSDDVEIDNFPPRAARITGCFDPRREIPVTYTVSHPRYLFGRTEFVQNARYCPKPPEDDETDYAGRTDPYEGRCWCCHWQTCDTNCTCGCDGCGTWTDTLTNDYEFASTNWPHMRRVLKIRRPLDYSDPCHLTVPTGERRCCPCPEHRTNGVALAYARRVSVVDPSGAEFRSSGEPLTVRIAATEPSYEPDDGTALFATNGAFSLQRDYTCLGVSFSHGTTDLAELNRVNRRFGLPVVVNTNLDEAASVRLNVDVLLRGGRIRLSVEDATTPFEVWRYDGRSEGYAKLADAATPLDLTMAEWRRLTDHESDGCVPSADVLLVAPHAGGATLVLHYWNVVDGEFVEDESRQAVTAINPPLLPDYDRDGKADMEDWNKITHGHQVWFWTNQDTWKGDDAFDEELWVRPNAEDLVVNGRYDAMNFLPLSIDLSALSAAWGTSQFRYELLTEGRELAEARMCIVEVARSSIGAVFDGDCLALDGTPMRDAEVAPIGTMTNLPAEVVRSAGTHAVVMEFPEAFRNRSLRLRVSQKADGAVFFSQAIKLNASPVDDMYGWVNLRRAIGVIEGNPTRLATPGWPVSEHEQGNLVFAHGYNISKDEARTWARGVFKKFWLAGLDTGFVAVTWFGNEGQIGWGSDVVTFNYYGNVQNAFETAPHYKQAMDGIPGPKWFLAHSLGNMLTSAAIQDFEMPHRRYFMLNAAVAMEAFDPAGGITADSHDNMTPRAWTNYADRVRSTHWFERFPEGDGRRLLTWKGRFCNVTNVVNFYSSEEEVLNDGDGEIHNLAKRLFVWYNQETRKGSWPLMLHEYEGGWEFNTHYDTTTNYWIGDVSFSETYRLPPVAANVLPDAQLREHPFFLDFCNQEMHSSSNGAVVANSYSYRAEMLAYAIPSESYAVGAHPLIDQNSHYYGPDSTALPCNHDMAAECVNGLEDLSPDESNEDRHWQHSTFVQRSYKRTRKLFKLIVEHMKEMTCE